MLSVEILLEKYRKSLEVMAGLASHKSASGLGSGALESMPCVIPAPHQILATPLGSIDSVCAIIGLETTSVFCFKRNAIVINLTFSRKNTNHAIYSFVSMSACNWKVMLYCHVTTQCNLLCFSSDLKWLRSQRKSVSGPLTWALPLDPTWDFCISKLYDLAS